MGSKVNFIKRLFHVHIWGRWGRWERHENIIHGFHTVRSSTRKCRGCGAVQWRWSDNSRMTIEKGTV